MEDNHIAKIHTRVYRHLTEKYPNLRFYLNVLKKRQQEINQGWWFGGQGFFVEILFWGNEKSSDIILFFISKTGNSRLSFYSYRDLNSSIGKKIITFFENLGEAIGTQMFKSNILKWSKQYKGTDYLQTLDHFLQTDKKIIDAFIESNKVQKYFPTIDLQQFNEAKQLIHTKQAEIASARPEYFEDKETTIITLHSFLFENISLFNTMQKIDFHSNMTCIIGLNGTGKTSLLRALVLAFTGVVQNNARIATETQQLTKQLHYLLTITGVKYGEPVYAVQGFTEISYTLTVNNQKDDALYQNRVLITSDEDVPRISDDSKSDFRNIINDGYKNLFLAFSQVQGAVNDAQNYNSNKKYPHIGDALALLNNLPDNRFGAFADWLRQLHRIANDKQTKGEKYPKERDLLKKIFEIISEVTGEKVRLHEIAVGTFEKDTISVIVGENTPPILFELVSQGYNNVFGWIGYFMKRLVEVEPEAADFTKTAGIVLIDEIDTYLHPQWQAQIMAVLIRQFPNVQFIVTTHSPYIVGSIPPDKVKIYICKKHENRFEVEAFTDFTPYGADLSRLSEKVFGVKGRFVTDVRLKLEQLTTLIHQGELAAAKKYLKEEFTEMDADDSDLQRSKMLIRTKEILSK